MLKQSARALFITHYVMIVLCLIYSFRPAAAHSDSISLQRDTSLHLSVIEKDIQCKGLPAGNSICSFKTELRQDNYLNRPRTSHQDFLSIRGDSDPPPQTDLMTVFKIALDEYDLLPGVRIYWESTARKIERWALKLKLKGEIPLSAPYDTPDVRSQTKAKQSERIVSARQKHSTSMLSLLMPQTIKWSLSMDPEDMNVSGNLHINSYLSFNARLGGESQVRLSFRYEF